MESSLEASDPSVKINVVYPNGIDPKQVDIDYTDANGDDFTCIQVKEQLLRQENLGPPASYTMYVEYQGGRTILQNDEKLIHYKDLITHGTVHLRA